MKQSYNLPAGNFSSWLSYTRSALQRNNDINVPCGSCTACCTSAYFVHIRPQEKQTLDCIPKRFLFPAPGLPAGNMLLGFDNNGHCPMLKNNICSIYKTRPQTCRTYDCRVFPATGLKAGEKEKDAINQQIRRWKFSFAGKDDHQKYSALQKTATFLRNHKKDFPEGFIPANTTQLAILAIKVYTHFINDIKDNRGNQKSDSQLVKAIVKTAGNFKPEFNLG